MRQIALDTETTGFGPNVHRIAEIGCVEIIDRTITGRNFHSKINPQREVHGSARRSHGYTWETLKDSPLFADICDDFISFVRGAEIVIQNASFDLSFLDSELQRLGRGNFTAEAQCTVVDTLRMAEKRYPKGENSLDALCDRYGIDRSHRQLHGALKDAKLLAQVYLAMTSDQ